MRLVTRMFLGYPVGAMLGGIVTAEIMSRVGWRGVMMAGGMCALMVIPLVGPILFPRAAANMLGREPRSTRHTRSASSYQRAASGEPSWFARRHA